MQGSGYDNQLRLPRVANETASIFVNECVVLLESLTNDLRYALRTMRRNLGASAVALAGAGIGAAAGVALAYALTRVLATLLFGVTANDPLAYVDVVAVLTAVAAVAALIPARRATHFDPAIALRYE
jgi:hypothetical protein